MNQITANSLTMFSPKYFDLQTTAKKSDDGSYYTLNGSKMWITNGCINDEELGDRYLIYARTGEGKVDGVSMFLVEKGYEGFSLGSKIKVVVVQQSF